MMPQPLTSTADRSDANNPYQGRWRWWYAAIADELIADPAGSARSVAAKLGRAEQTVRYIMNSDIFREYFAQRRALYSAAHDHTLRSKMTDVAEEGLDIIAQVLKDKKTTIPLKQLESLTSSVLDRLGYSSQSQAPQVVVNQNVDARSQHLTLPGLSASDLEEARMALRAAEAMKAGSSLPVLEKVTSPVLENLEAEPNVLVSDIDPLEEFGDVAIPRE